MEELELLYNGLVEDGKYTKSFEEFKNKFSTEEAISSLHSGLLEDGDYTKDLNSFKDKFFKSVVEKKNESSEPTAKKPQSGSVTPQEVQGTSSATTQPMETQELASLNGEVEPPVTNLNPLSSLSSEEVLKLQDRAQKQLSEEYKESGSKEEFSITPEQINERALELYEVDQDLVKFEESDWIDDTWNSLKSNALGVIESIASIPSMKNDVLFTLFADEKAKEALNKLDVDQRNRVLNKALAINGLEAKFNDSSSDVANEMRELSKKIQEKTTQFDRSVIDDIRDGNYYKAGSRIATQGVGSIPSIVQAMIPGGIASMVAGGAAKKNDELQREGEDLEFKTLLNSSISGAAEGLLEIFTKKMGNKMWDSLGGDIAVKEGISIISGFVENLVLDPLKEGASEGATSLIQNLSDLYIQGKEKEFKKVWEEVAESFLVGAFTGGAMGSVTSIAQNTKRLKESSNIDDIVDSGTNEFTSVKDAFSPENKKDILDKLRIASYSTSSQKLDKDLKKAQDKGEITEEQAEEYRSELSKVQGQLNKTKNLGLSDEARVEAVELVDKKEGLKKEIEGLDDALAAPKKEEIAKIDERLTELATNKKQNNEKEQPGTQNETTNQEGNKGTETTYTDTEQKTGETEVQEEVVEPTQEVEIEEKSTPDFSDDSYKNATPKQKTKFVKDIITDSFKGKKVDFSAFKMKSMINKALDLDPNNEMKSSEFVSKVKEVIVKEELKRDINKASKDARDLRRASKKGRLGLLDNEKVNSFVNMIGMKTQYMSEDSKKIYIEAVNEVKKRINKRDSSKIDYEKVNELSNKVIKDVENNVKEKNKEVSAKNLYTDIYKQLQDDNIEPTYENIIKEAEKKSGLTDDIQFVKDNKDKFENLTPKKLKEKAEKIPDQDLIGLAKEVNDNVLPDLLEDVDVKKENIRAYKEIKSLIKGITPETLKEMSDMDRVEIFDILSELNNDGIVDSRIADKARGLREIQKKNQLIKATENLSISWLRWWAKAKNKVAKSYYAKSPREQAKANAVLFKKLDDIDRGLGNKSKNGYKAIERSVLESSQKAMANADSRSRVVTNKLNDIKKSLGKNDLQRNESSYRIYAYMLDKYRKSNPNVKTVNTLQKYLEETIKSKNSNLFEEDIAFFEKMLEEDINESGELKNPEKFLSEKEKKAEKQIRELIDSETQSSMDSKLFDGGVVEVSRNNFMHLDKVATQSGKDVESNLSGNFNNYTPKSSNLKSQEDASPAALNFDVFSVVSNATRNNIKQSEMTQANKESRNVAKKAMEEVENKIDNLKQEKKKETNEDKIKTLDNQIQKLKEQQVALIYVQGLIEKTYSDLNDSTGNTEESLGAKMIQVATERMYAYMLGTVKKIVNDYIGNFIAIASMSGKKVANNFDLIKDIFTKMDNNQKLEFFTALGCDQASRLASSDLSVRGAVEYSRNSSLTKKSKSNLKKKSNTGKALGFLADAEKAMQGIREFMVANADTNASTILWTAEFSDAFEKATGKKIDADAVKRNDSKYLLENQDAIDKASRIANNKLTTLSSSKNAFADFKNLKGKSTQEVLWGLSETFMRGMIINDANKVADEFNNILYGTKRDESSVAESMWVIAGLASRTAIYMEMTKLTVMGAYLGGKFVKEQVSEIMGWEEEDDEKMSQEDKFKDTVDKLNQVMSKLGAELDSKTKKDINDLLKKYSEYNKKTEDIEESSFFNVPGKMFLQGLSNYALGGAGASVNFVKDQAIEYLKYWEKVNVQKKEYDKYEDALMYNATDFNKEGGKLVNEFASNFVLTKLGMSKPLVDATLRGRVSELGSLALGVPTGDLKAMSNYIKYETEGGENSKYVKYMETTIYDLLDNLKGVDKGAGMTIDETVDSVKKGLKNAKVDGKKILSDDEVDEVSELTRDILVLSKEINEALKRKE